MFFIGISDNYLSSFSFKLIFYVGNSDFIFLKQDLFINDGYKFKFLLTFVFDKL